LAHKLGPACAKSSPDREFLLTAETTGNQQIRNIRAGYEQNQT
jgi:hypothetical protein